MNREKEQQQTRRAIARMVTNDKERLKNSTSPVTIKEQDNDN